MVKVKFTGYFNYINVKAVTGRVLKFWFYLVTPPLINNITAENILVMVVDYLVTRQSDDRRMKLDNLTSLHCRRD